MDSSLRLAGGPANDARIGPVLPGRRSRCAVDRCSFIPDRTVRDSLDCNSEWGPCCR